MLHFKTIVLTKVLENKSNVLFIVLAGFFLVNGLTAEFIGVKILSLEATMGIEPFSFSLFGIKDLGFIMSAGVVLWPVIFIMTDIVNEYFGPRGVRFLSYLAVILFMYAFAVVYMAIGTSPSEWWDTLSGVDSENPEESITSMNYAYSKIFGQGTQIIFASMVAFLVGQILDVFVFHKIKEVTGENKLWLRATGSTMISQFIDSYIVGIIAFYILDDWTLATVCAIGTVNYIYKFVIAIVLTPLLYLIHNVIDRYLGAELASKLKTDAMLKA